MTKLKKSLALLSGAYKFTPYVPIAPLACSIPPSFSPPRPKYKDYSPFAPTNLLESGGKTSLNWHLTIRSCSPWVDAPYSPYIKKQRRTLYQLLSCLPNYGVGMRVRQRQWAFLDVEASNANQGEKTLADNAHENMHLCYYVITAAFIRKSRRREIAWGKLVWKGRWVSKRRSGVRIRNALDYDWDVVEEHHPWPPLPRRTR